MAPLVGQKVVIIGGSSGIGFSLAKAAMNEGAKVVIASSNLDKAQAAAQRLGASDHPAAAYRVDVTDEESVKAFYEHVGAFDHLVLTHGRMYEKPNFPHMNIADKKDIFDSRFWGSVSCIKHALPYLAATGSITTTTGAMMSRIPPGWALGFSSSGALDTFTRGIAFDLAPRRANCIAPGWIDTEWFQDWSEEQRNDFLQSVVEKLPIKRMGTPEAVAEAYLYVMKCDYVTGQTLYIDGGLLLAP